MSRFLPALVTALIWLGLIVLNPAFTGLEIRSLDSRFRQRTVDAPMDPSIALILVDRETLNEDTFDNHPNPLKKHATAYWLPFFGKVIKTVLDQGANCVGLDWIPWDIPEEVYHAALPPEDLPKDQFPWQDLGEAVLTHPGKWVQAVGASDPGKDSGERTWSSHKAADELLALVGRENLAYVNLVFDSDEVVRRQILVPLPTPPNEREEWGIDSLPSFVALIAERNKRPVPYELLEQKQFVRVNFLPPGRFPRYSFGQVLAWSRYNPERIRQAFKGKTVLIGASDPIFHDQFTTPVGTMVGVEIHANTLNTIFTGSFLKSPRRLTRHLLTGLFCLAAALVGFHLRPGRGAWLVVSCLVGYAALCFFAFSHWGYWLEMLRPIFGAAACWLCMVLIQVRRDEKQQAQVRQLFGRYVSDAVMEQLLKDPGQSIVGAVGKKRVTVLFSDINGFSGKCEKCTPEEVLSMLNAYFHEMNEIIFAYGGTIKQFVGDEIMVMYGAPAHHYYPEIAAVRSAVDMIRRLKELKRADPDGEHGFYEVKIGVHSGNVILGNVGSKRRTEYAAVGDDVNLGSRLMGMCKQLEAKILISADTYEHVKELDGMQFIHKGKHPVKGRKEPIEIYAVEPVT